MHIWFWWKAIDLPMSCHCPGQHTLPSYWPTRNLLRNLGLKADSSIIEESAFTINFAFCWKRQDYFLSSVTIMTSAMAQCDNCDKCDKCSGTVWRFPVVGTFVLLDGNDPNAPKASKCRPPAAGRRSWRHQVILTPFPSLQAIVHIINFGLEFSSNIIASSTK